MQELSESLWKAKDEAGATEKALERKLKQAQEQVESTAASARSEVLAQAREGQRALLRQLFPGVAVAEEGGDSKYEMWLERFEAEAQDVMSRKEEEVSLPLLIPCFSLSLSALSLPPSLPPSLPLSLPLPLFPLPPSNPSIYPTVSPYRILP